VKSSLTVIAYPELARANASATLAYIYRPALRRKIAARPGSGALRWITSIRRSLVR
jgi:hypothetical protein